MFKSLGSKNLAAAAILSFAVVIGMAVDTSAQSRRDIERERQRNARQDARRDQQSNRRQPSRDVRTDGARGNDRLSSRAVNATLYQGYQQGLIAGQSDGRARKYNRFNVYRNTGAARNSGDPSSTDYLYRQGYLEGYEDGYRGRVRY